ncbi:MAG: ABC transporter permease [Caloramator sp.]|nr:ABC transporter permease [Caloramator sp.]
MFKYIVKRILQAIPLLFIITLITFLIINLAPGEPIYMFIDPESAKHVNIEVIKHKYGLDQPIHIRYFVWLKGILKFDFGISFLEKRPVLQMINQRLFATISLMLVSVIISFLIAIPAGIVSAVKRNSVGDYLFSTLSFIGVSIPSFWFGLMLILLFSLKLGWLPSSGMRENFDQFDFVDRLKHIILPACVLAFGTMASKMRYMRSSMLEVIRQDYIRTARSKGLSERIVIWKHAFRNALLPIITLLGMLLPGIFGGAVAVETVFGWPGMGRMIVQSTFSRDYPVIMGTELFSSILVIIGSLIADVLYAVADPRIKYN